VQSISSALGTEEWMRIRIGVGRTTTDGQPIKAGGKEYLLAPMKNAALNLLDEALDQAAGAVEAWLARGPAAAMNEFNRKGE
jgi:PTH1 family peptidyl-tRNA hydrolase